MQNFGLKTRKKYSKIWLGCCNLYFTLYNLLHPHVGFSSAPKIDILFEGLFVCIMTFLKARFSCNFLAETNTEFVSMSGVNNTDFLGY
jgi:hypothetical protein